MRAGQPFSMRYPLIEVEGAYGNLMESGNWSAPRYTSSRLSVISNYLFKDIQKNTVDEWRDNYDDTEQYPTVLPSKGYYNICNPTMGIGVGAASSIPGFNLNDVNKALIYLLKNPDCNFEDIYCAPDFPTGGILLNEDDVKESLKKGTGKAAILRAVIEYDSDDNCLIVKEIPYGVYTNTICKQLETIVSTEENTGIERFNDLTGGSGVNMKIYLTKRANPEKVVRKLFKETSLQSHYSINMVMLDNGRFPRVFTWKEALQAHINHEKEVYKRGFEFDRQKAQDRLHIVEGILIAIANIEEVIKTIKESPSSIAASINLQKNFNLSEIQAKAILEIKLARLAHLEVEKYEKEKAELESTIERINKILSDKELFDQQLIDGWTEVMTKYGDERRTKIMNLKSTDEDEPIEEKQLVIHLTSHNALFAYEDTTLIASRKTKGTKVKIDKNELITTTVKDTNIGNLLLFSSIGKVYSLPANSIQLNMRIPIETIVELSPGETITSIVSDNDKDAGDSVVFVTKNGLVKRTLLSEYSTKRAKGIIALKLGEGDQIKKALVTNSKEKIAIITKDGYYVSFSIDEIPIVGRNAKGVKGISLRANDEVVDSIILDSSVVQLVTITKNGMIKRSPMVEFTEGSRANKGVLAHKLQDNDTLVGIAPVYVSTSLVSVSSTKAVLKFPIKDVRLGMRATVGTKAMNIKENEYLTGVISE